MSNNSKHFTHGDNISSADLIGKWVEILLFYDQLIANGHQLDPIRNLVSYIIKKGYNIYLFPSSSLFNLLVSVPLNNKVNYNKTLKIELDQLRNIIKFDYRDYAGLNREVYEDFEKSLKWTKICKLSESCNMIDFFISEIIDLKARTK
jgi:hypothetical protein